MPEDRNASDRTIWLLVAGLLFLRIPFLAGVRWFTGFQAPEWVLPAFEIGTYCLTALLVWCERDRLADYHVDRAVVVVLMLGKPLELVFYSLDIPSAWPQRSDLYLLHLPISIWLLVALLAARPQLPRLQARSWLWALGGVLGGIVLGILTGYLIRLQMGYGGTNRLTQEILIFLPIQQMIHAGMAEEPLFRGFLWGLLRRAGWKDIWIWLLQAGLFWLAHIYYLGRSPLSFWVILPLGGLVFGLMAWGSRSILTSILGHGYVNGVGQIVAYYRL